MGSFTDHVELKVLDHLFGASNSLVAFSANMYYIGLSTTTITDAGGNITEPSGNGYARCAATNNKTTFGNAAAGSVNNAVALGFPQASGSWGTVIDFFLANHATQAGASQIFGYGTLGTSKTIQSGDTPSFAVNALQITLD